MFCTKCGKEIPDGSVFCNYCGNNMRADTVNAAPQQFANTAPAAKPKKGKGKIIGLVIGGVVLVAVIAVLIIVIIGKNGRVENYPVDEVYDYELSDTEIFDNELTEYTDESLYDDSIPITSDITVPDNELTEVTSDKSDNNSLSGTSKVEVSGNTATERTEKASDNNSDKNSNNISVSGAAVGDIITFGSYEQDNNTSNGKEKIEWRVLDKKNGKLLIISEKALDAKPYNDELEVVTWETSTMRKWLNGTFYNNAFSSSEQAQIASTKVINNDNIGNGTEGGNDTTDKVFLLSYDEANKYFSDDNDRMCLPTKYAIAEGANAIDKYKKDGEEACWWWLRSPGDSSEFDESIYAYGRIDDCGGDVNTVYGVRPVMWVEV